MVEKKTSEAQLKANRKWEEKNREKTRQDTARRQARSFIRNRASLDDLYELEQLISERRQILNDPHPE